MSDDVISSCVREAAGVGFEMDMESRCWLIVHGGPTPWQALWLCAG